MRPMPKPSRHRTTSHGSAIVSWCLLLMSLAVFAPCVLLPEWRALEHVHGKRQQEEHRLTEMKRAVERKRGSLTALRHDPAVITRLAQRELRFRGSRDTSVRVSVAWQDAGAAETPPPFTPTALPLPRVLTDIAGRLPALNYDRVFCDDHTRIVLMCLSIGLVLVALCMPGRSTACARGGRNR